MTVGWTTLAAGLVLVLGAPRVGRAQSAWTVDLGTEHSFVTLNGADIPWTTTRVQVGEVRPETGGWNTAVERQERGSLVDVVTSVSGYRRLGDWTIGGGVSGSPHPSFVYRESVEGQLSRRIVGTTVASIAYRYLDFVAVGVQQIQPALSWYHRRGEVEGRLYVTRKGAGTSDSVTGAVSTLFDVTPRLRFAMSAAYGDRIFDVAALPTENATASIVNARLRFGVTAHDFIEAGVGVAHENPVFAQRTISLVYRRAF